MNSFIFIIIIDSNADVESHNRLDDKLIMKIDQINNIYSKSVALLRVSHSKNINMILLYITHVSRKA